MSADRIVAVTGAFGLLGQRVVAELHTLGSRVVAIDIESVATRSHATRLAGRGSLDTVWADVTDPTQLAEVLGRTQPNAVVHLAGIVPPLAWRNPALAHRVNVGGTVSLLEALRTVRSEALLVHASSVAVHGPRNGAVELPLLDATTARRPADAYGYQKAAAEELIEAADCDWTILRLGGIIGPELLGRVDSDTFFMQQALPSNSRIHTVDVADAGRAFAVAASDEARGALAAGKVLMIGGDDSHRRRQCELSEAFFDLAGLGPWPRVAGRRGDPTNDEAWFSTDWMDTTEANAILDFQQRSWNGMLAGLRSDLDARRRLLLPAGVPARLGLSALSMRKGRGPVDVMASIGDRFGAASLQPGAEPSSGGDAR